MAPRIALGAAVAAAAFTDVSALGRGATRRATGLGFVSAPPAAAQRVSAADSARSSVQPPSAVADGAEASLAAGAGLVAAATLAAAAVRGVSQRGRPSARRLVACAAEAAEAGAASAEGEKAADKKPAEEAKKGAEEKPAEEGSEEEADDSLESPTVEKEPVYGDEEPTEEAKKATKWSCSGCGAMNFAQSAECSKCGAPKPSEEEEALVLARNEAKDEVGKTMDELIRLQADLQNYRRKHDESMSRAKSLGKEDTLRKLVPIMEDIEKALVPPENMSEKETAIFTSYSMLTRKVSDVFEKLGVSQLETEVGQKFSPGDHLKVEEREAPGDETPGTIVEVLKPGYGCEGKVIIPSEVAIVAFPPEEETETKAEEAKDEAEEDEDEAKEEGEEKAEDKEEVKEGAK